MPDRGTNFGISAIIRDWLATHPLTPSPLKERGIKGVRLVNTLIITVWQDIKACIIMIVRS